jgi:hypothetical protein
LTLKAGEQKKRARDDIMARLPQDKQRICSEKMEELLIRNLEEFLAGLPRERILSLLEKELARRTGELPSKGLTIQYRGLEKAEAQGIFNRVLPGGSWQEGGKDPLFEHQGKFPAIRIDAPDMRITASIDMIKETLLEDRRAELASCLFGGVQGPWELLLTEDERHD